MALMVQHEKVAADRLEVLVDDYETACRARGIAAETVKYGYCWPIRRTLLPWCRERGITDPEQLDNRTLNRWTVHLHDVGGVDGPIKPSSINTYVGAVNRWLRWLRSEEEIHHQAQAQETKEPKRVVDVLVQAEVDAMAAAAGNERDRLIVETLWETGLRASELLGLRPGDLVERYGKGGLLILAPDAGGGAKGSRERWVPAPRIFRPLRRYAAKRPAGSDYIFLAVRRDWSGTCPRLKISGLDKMIRLLGAEAGLQKRVYPHLFRHSAITRWLRAGMNPLTAAQIAGHANLVMIQRVYSHLNEADAWEALAAVLAK